MELAIELTLTLELVRVYESLFTVQRKINKNSVSLKLAHSCKRTFENLHLHLPLPLPLKLNRHWHKQNQPFGLYQP